MTLASRIATAALAVPLLLLAAPGAASASDPLQSVSGSGCWSAGSGTFSCIYNISGGTAPYTAVGTTGNGWASIRQITISGSDSSYEVLAEGSCTVGKSSSARITVTDAEGQSLTLGGIFQCTAWSQQ